MTETITVDFPGYGKHGIFRFWDIIDDNSPHARRTPEDISVTRDGSDEPFELSWEDHHRQRVAKIGSASTTLDVGEHTYVIKYHIDGVLDENVEKATGDERHEFYWQLIPRRLAAEHRPVHADGPPAGGGAGRRQVRDRRRLRQGLHGRGRRHTRPHRDHRPDRRPDPGHHRHRPRHEDAARGQLACPGPAAGTASSHPPAAARLVLLAAAGRARASARSWAPSRGRSRRASRCSTSRPAGIGPAQAKYIYSETVDRTTYVATLMHAAEKGAVDLDPRRERPWTITDKAGPAGWGGLDAVTTDIAHILGGPGSSFTAQQEGRRGRAAAQGRDRAVRQQRRDLGEDLRQHGQQRARRLRRPAGARRLRPDAGRAPSGTRSR